MPYGIANKNGPVHGNEIEAILDLAWENGIYTIDTAKAYGNSEESIGNYLKQRTERPWNIITKISDGGKNIASQIKDSDEKLTVHPEVVLAHSVKLFLDEKFQSELKEEKKKRLINKIGVSIYSENEINEVLVSGYKLVVLQMPLNILGSKMYRKGLLTQLYEKGIEIHIRSAFLQGLFYLPDVELEFRFGDAVPYLNKLKSIANEVDLSIAELSLLWLVSLEEVCKVVIGVDNVNQLKAHLETLEKNVNTSVFKKALSVHYENETILNPSLWQSKS